MTIKLFKGKWKGDLVLRLGSLWVGVHHSPRYECYCITPFPCITFRIGKTDYLKD
jgi:hypothetical protein